jgi:hypothetical protein
LAKIFIKSLQEHLQNTIELVNDNALIADELKEVISLIKVVAEACRVQLEEHEFILVVGILCEIFPNRVLS